MLNFILSFTTGGQVEITEDEYKSIFKADDSQSVAISRLGIMVQKRMVQIFPKSIADEIENRKQQQTGVLHDGTRVIRRFGEWVVAGEQTPDDDGKYQPIKLDKEYYPEVAADCVATEKEWEQIKGIEDYYKLTGYKPALKRISTEELTPIF